MRGSTRHKYLLKIGERPTADLVGQICRVAAVHIAAAIDFACSADKIGAAHVGGYHRRYQVHIVEIH